MPRSTVWFLLLRTPCIYYPNFNYLVMYKSFMDTDA